MSDNGVRNQKSKGRLIAPVTRQPTKTARTTSGHPPAIQHAPKRTTRRQIEAFETPVGSGHYVMDMPPAIPPGDYRVIVCHGAKRAGKKTRIALWNMARAAVIETRYRELLDAARLAV